MPLGRHRSSNRTAFPAPPESATRIESSLADELRQRLERGGEIGLIAAVDELRVVERCTCDDARCESFYTLPSFHASWLWNRGGRTIQLGNGLAIDAVGNRIVAVEIIRLDAET